MVSDQESLDSTITEILTEHLGFQPIAIIDDIINVINDIMYECTQSLEKLLINRKLQIDSEIENLKKTRISIESRKDEQRDDDDDDVIMNDEDQDNKRSIELNRIDKQIDELSSKTFKIEDVEKGTASLESLLEHVINKNFDKFEIYTLRNILSIPPDLVTGGYIQLKHQNELNVTSDDIDERNRVLDEEYKKLVKEIEIELILNKELNLLIVKFQRILKLSDRLKLKLNFVGHSNNESTMINTTKYLSQLNPLKDTFKFLINEIQTMYGQLNSVKNDLSNDVKEVSKLKNNESDRYLNERIAHILKEVNGDTNQDRDEEKMEGDDKVEFMSKLNVDRLNKILNGEQE